MICPKCDGKIDAVTARLWGDGEQKMPLAPYLCAWCASLMLINLVTRELFTPEAIKDKFNIDMVATMKTNAVLWAAIEEARAEILALPKRRTVLR
jgi:hypothetical protein